MKLKALNTFYVQHEKRVVAVDDEFETTNAHGEDLIKNGLAKFLEGSEMPDQLVPDESKALDELKLKVSSLEAIIAEKDTKIAELQLQLNDLNAQLTTALKASEAPQDDGEKPDSEDKPEDDKAKTKAKTKNK